VSATGQTALSSCLYEGTLTHVRLGPGPHHRFVKRIAMPLVFLDELEALEAESRLFSASGAAPLRYRRQDFLAPSDVPLAEAVAQALVAGGRPAPRGRIALLAHLRTLGWQFNPLSLYLAFDEDGAVESLVAEVENTPWHERHPYVVGPPGTHDFAKELHVSPFLPMGLDYRLDYDAPDERLRVRLEVAEQGQRRFVAALEGRRRPLDRAGIRRLLLRHPLGAQRVTAGIYAQAGHLVFKRAPYHPHPEGHRPSWLRRSGR
jgi:uncharacterized protein